METYIIMSSHYNAIIDECRSSLRRLGSPAMVHCFREQNGVANALVNKGVESEAELGIALFEIPSMCAQQSL